MRRQISGIGLSVGLAIAFSIGAGGQAQAATSSSGYIECYPSGTFGQLNWSGFKVGTTGEVEISLALSDVSADGHHPQIRLVTEYYSGDKHYWPWHAYYDGAGSGYTWNTYAKDPDGMYAIGVQVGNFEGNTQLSSETCW
ncbi:hypothetical protein [Streptomyces sp. NPDC001100]